MYNEKSFKNHIFWMKVKRVFLIIVFAIAGAVGGVFASDLLVNVLFFDLLYKIPIIIVSTLLGVALALLLTAGTGKAVQDAYWKMALLRKVIVISKKLDNVSIVANDELDEMIDTLNEFEGVNEEKKSKKNNGKRNIKLKNPREKMSNTKGA